MGSSNTKEEPVLKTLEEFKKELLLEDLERLDQGIKKHLNGEALKDHYRMDMDSEKMKLFVTKKKFPQASIDAWCEKNSHKVFQEPVGDGKWAIFIYLDDKMKFAPC